MHCPSWLMKVLVGASPRRTLIRLVIVAAVAFVVFRFLFPPVFARGQSMEPTIRDRTFHLVNTLAYARRAPVPGDVVVIVLAGRRLFYLKRVLAAPGERIAFDRGALVVDGSERPEPYLHDRGSWSMKEVPLAADEYFVAGDNRTMSRREHKAGITVRGNIVGGLLF